MSAVYLIGCVRLFTPYPSLGLDCLHIASPVTQWRNSCNPLVNQKITGRVTKVSLSHFRAALICNSTALGCNFDDRSENSQRSVLLLSDQQHFGALIRECFLKRVRSCIMATPPEFQSSISSALILFGSPQGHSYTLISNLDYGEST